MLNLHEYALGMRVLYAFCPQNACPARAPCLFGTGATLVWLANHACAARQQRLLCSSGWLFGGGNKAFGGAGGEAFFSFRCKDFAIVLRGSYMRIFTSEILGRRAVGRNFAILAALAEQSVTLSSTVRDAIPGSESALWTVRAVAFVCVWQKQADARGLVIKKYNFCD